MRYRCPGCGYVYDEAAGAPREGWKPGTPFRAIDPEWCCPDCGVREAQDFEELAR
jgi:rubredoxin